MADEFAEMMKAMSELSEAMVLFNKLYTEVGKCRHCGKGGPAEILAFWSNPLSDEALKKFLCSKHRKMFEELEQKAKAAEKSE